MRVSAPEQRKVYEPGHKIVLCHRINHVSSLSIRVVFFENPSKQSGLNLFTSSVEAGHSPAPEATQRCGTLHRSSLYLVTSPKVLSSDPVAASLPA